MRLGDRGTRVHGLLRGVEFLGFGDAAAFFAFGAVREDAFHRGFPVFLHLVEIEALAAGDEFVRVGRLADYADFDAVGHRWQLRIVIKLNEERAIGRGEQVVHGDGVGELDADAIAECHLE